MVTRFLASIHDGLYVGAARYAEAALGPPPYPYALLLLGSGARRESTLRTDQDHALVLADDPPSGADDWFAALAERLATTLERCGLPRCPRDVMATNPTWRVPLGAWQDRFVRCIEQPDEAALLEAATFFDFRQVYGDLAAEQPLRRVVRGAAGNGRSWVGWPRRRCGAGQCRGSSATGRVHTRDGSTSRHTGPRRSSTWPGCSRWRRAVPRRAPRPACMPQPARAGSARPPSASWRPSTTSSSYA